MTVALPDEVDRCRRSDEGDHREEGFDPRGHDYLSSPLPLSVPPFAGEFTTVTVTGFPSAV